MAQFNDQMIYDSKDILKNIPILYCILTVRPKHSKLMKWFKIQSDVCASCRTSSDSAGHVVYVVATLTAVHTPSIHQLWLHPQII